MKKQITDHFQKPLPEAVLNSLSAHVIVISADGTILANNQKWKPCSQEYSESLRARSQVSHNYLELCKELILEGNDYALKITLGITSVLKGERDTFIFTYPGYNTSGDHTWMQLKAVPLDEQRSGLVIVHEETVPNTERDRKLRESEERYHRQFNNSLEGIMITTTNGRCVDANPTACRLLKYSKEELLELTREDIVVTTHHGFQDALKQRQETGTYRAEFPLKRKDGEIIMVEAFSKIYRNELGEIRSIFNFRDITARKKTEQQLESEIKFSDSIVKSIPGIFFVMDEEGDLVRWNETVLHAFGYEPGELGKMSAFDLVHPEDRALARQAIAKIHETGHAEVELRTYSKNSATRHYIFNGNKLETDGQAYVVVSGIDITAQKEAEAATQRHREMMDQLFKNSPIGIAMINKEHEIMRINKSFTDIFGYAQQEATGRNIDKLLINDSIEDKAQKLSEQGFEGDTFQVDTVRIAKDGTNVPVLVGSVPVKVEDNLIALFGMYADISERKKLEEQIRNLLEKEKEARKNAEKAKIRFEEMFTRAPSAICILEGPDHRYSFANDSYQTLIGREEVVGRAVAEVLPELKRQDFLELLDQVYSTGEPYTATETPIMLNKNGNDELEQLFLNLAFKPLTDDRNQVYGIFVEVIDVTEQVQNRKQLSRSLMEKEVLIKEIHHRVKNNLALISSMIELQLDNAQECEESPALYATKSRVHTIAQIHELIYQYEDFSNIPFQEYLQEMAKFSRSLHGPNMGPLEVNMNLNAVLLNINQAIPFGLLINEIIGKIEQAVSAKRSYTLGIGLQKRRDEIQLKLTFEGISQDGLLSFEETNSLNDTLIQTLAKQLNADISIAPPAENKHSVTVTFRLSDRKGPASQLD